MGLTAWEELNFRLFGLHNYTALQLGNVFAILGTVYAGYRIVSLLFDKRRVEACYLLLMACCFPLLIFSAYIYGDVLSIFLSMLVLWQTLRMVKTEKKSAVLWMVPAAAAAVALRSNSLIVLIAVCCVLGVKAITGKKWIYLLCVLLLGVGAFAGKKAIYQYYEAKSGTVINDGMPSVLWIAMGMQEGERAEGWYNEFNFDTYVNSDCDPAVSDAIAKEAIAESLQHFQKDPAYAARFYLRKTLSQWNEPTYEALWVNQFHSGDFSTIVQSIYEGKLYQVLSEYMNLFQLLVFAAVFAGFLIGIKVENRWQLPELFLPMVILGGFFFHTLWEAKSQYIFPYFVCMLPGAAAGLSGTLRKWNSHKKEK